MTSYTQKLILVISVSLSALIRIYGCSCSSGSSIAESVRVASVVFSGTVLSVNASSDHRWSVYKIKIDRLFKGKVKANTIAVWTPGEGTACGIKFISKKALVYATDAAFYRPQPYTRGISFYTNVCTRSGSYLLSEEKGMLKALSRV